MKRYWRAVGLFVLLGLTACQNSHQPSDQLSSAAMAKNRAAVQTLITQPVQQEALYFAADGQYSNTPVAGGYYRQVLGKTAAGNWVAQDFYQATKTKQTDPFVIVHPEGLRNFDNDVVDGWVVWYRPDGSLLQTQAFQRGKATGWLNVYDPHGRLRSSEAYANGEATGELRYFDAKGRKQMEQGSNAAHQVTQTFWYDNGNAAIEVVGDSSLKGWQRNGEALNEDQVAALWEYLESLLYQEPN
ncbi:toxin-antitoxin system YwqK family antitoxin [Snodgrassella sp. CFCC 13594]|uniref:toxin-antitoxin system YwqK family antitoxin n=1 Tax=Snodgrassella sp. CFCC 13594 TaxID=1775559 RepID=UPI00082BA1A9|nr:hypothetical protein [Snodgrassella sp. CFCC 13594]